MVYLLYLMVGGSIINLILYIIKKSKYVPSEQDNESQVIDTQENLKDEFYAEAMNRVQQNINETSSFL